MMSPDLRFEGFDAKSWGNLLSLFSRSLSERLDSPASLTEAPDVVRGDGTDKRRGTLYVVVDADGVGIAGTHSLRGRLRDLVFDSKSDLEKACADYGARRIIVIREGVAEEIAERLGARLARSDHYFEQCLCLLSIISEFREAGLIRVFPTLLGNFPLPDAAMVRRTLDIALPDERAAAFAIWEGSHLWTAIVLRRRRGNIDLVAGPDALSRWTGPLGGDWRRDYRVVADSVERAVGPLHFGFFSELQTVQSLLQSPQGGSWARAALVRDIVTYPTPPYVGVALGADAARGIAHASAHWLGGFDVSGVVAPIFDLVRVQISEVASITKTLGFNPLQLIAATLRSETGRSSSSEGSTGGNSAADSTEARPNAGHGNEP